MVKLTAKELALLDCIAMNSYAPSNYSRPSSFEETGMGVWSHSLLDTGSKLAETLNPRSVPGITASLLKKGMVYCGDTGTKDAFVGMTREGYDAWLAAFPDPVIT